jgi:ABC-type lipoprotein release transport system permease subunit
MGSLASGAVGIGGLVAALIVGLSLTDIGDQPDRWGVNYDQLFGNPYIDATADLVAPVLPLADVAAVSGVNIGGLLIDDRGTDVFAFDAAKGNLVPTTLQGRPPSTVDEIGLGAEVARALDVDIGETVTAIGPMGDSAELTVVGIVVTPDAAGGGAAMTFDGYAIVNPTATQNVLVVDFVDDPSPDAVAQVQAANFTPPDALIKPTSVRALQRVVAAPFALAIMLIVLLIVACAYLLATSVRARQRDFSVLRALGAVDRQLNAVVYWQATLSAAVVVAVGLPIGIIIGRWIVGSLTDTLGIVPGVAVPPAMLVAVVVVSITMANVAAFLPARRAARANVVELTRDR